MPDIDRRAFFGLMGRMVAAGAFIKGLATGGQAHAITKQESHVVNAADESVGVSSGGAKDQYEQAKQQPKSSSSMAANTFILSQPGGPDVPLYLTSFNCTEECEVPTFGASHMPVLSKQVRLDCRFYVDSLSSEQLQDMAIWNGQRLTLRSSMQGMSYEGEVIVTSMRVESGAGEATMGELEMLAVGNFRLWQEDVKAHY